ncbi:MAG: fused MFS/spermidine synthase [Sphingomicrobium sp.]
MATSALRTSDLTAPARMRFVMTIFAGSFLLFLVQPMIARMALPRLGGAPSVWNSAMLVYQLLLLAGYAYSHWLGRLAPRSQAALHLTAFIVAGAMLPIGLIGVTPPSDANIFLWVPWLLLVSIGPLFLLVSAQAPLIQRWYALSGGGDPYPLYAASNAGSFCGLIAYPLLAEPLLPVAVQRVAWSAGYALLVLLAAWCALRLPSKSSAQAAPAQTQPIARSTIAKWVLLAAVPSGLMLATTLHITTDLVAMPLLWVLPLGLYLLSFTVAFAADRRLANSLSRLAPVVLLAAAYGVFSNTPVYAAAFAAVALIGLFFVSAAIHAQLYDLRPDPAHLTTFYLAMSVGGALGGLFCALVAPMIFDWTYEFPILVVAAAYILGANSPFPWLQNFWRSGGAPRVARWSIPVVLLIALAGQGTFGMAYSPVLVTGASMILIALPILAIGNRVAFAAAVAALMLATGGWSKIALSVEPGRMTRSFFGIYSIRTSGDGTRMLVHGTTIHGIQRHGSPDLERYPTSYYARQSGVGLALAAAGEHARIDVVGLGAGTLACYSRPGQSWRFYEIDPAVVRIARNPKQFTFLSRCQPNVQIAIGDARLTLERSPPASADILIVDAFSSDSVPMHLLTREAFRAYRRHLAPGGLLLVHISNRFLDLGPVVATEVSDGWTAGLRAFVPNDIENRSWQTASTWIALSRSAQTIARLEKASGEGRWTPLMPRPGFTAWTDDHASILPIIKWTD